MAGHPETGTPALVVAPTHEPARPTEEQRRRPGPSGGMGARPAPLRRSMDLPVACPGRPLDHLGQGSLRLDRVRILVLDEGDHLVDMGFLPDVRRILGACRRGGGTRGSRPRCRRSSPPGRRRAARSADPEVCNTAPAATIEDGINPVPEAHKPDLRARLLSGRKDRPVIAFTRTRHRANG